MKMTTVVRPLFLSSMILLLTLTMLATGCGKKKIENPYETATLATAVSGESEYKLFKYELTEPTILAVEGRLALLSEEDRIEFIIGDDLNLLNSVEPGFKLGVRREWGVDPEVYLVLEHVIDGPDTTFITSDEVPVFPSFQNFAAFEKSAYMDLMGELASVRSGDRNTLLKSIGAQGSKIWMEGKLSRAEVGGQMLYFIENAQGKFQLEGVGAIGEVFLKALLKLGGETTAFGPLGEIARPRQQRETGITGPLTLEYFQFQGYLITNG
jgi:hypothetical protein